MRNHPHKIEHPYFGSFQPSSESGLRIYTVECVELGHKHLTRMPFKCVFAKPTLILSRNWKEILFLSHTLSSVNLSSRRCAWSCSTPPPPPPARSERKGTIKLWPATHHIARKPPLLRRIQLLCVHEEEGEMLLLLMVNG